MKDIEELRKNRDVIDSIDWDMTPEDAVRLYLEWGNNWSRGNLFIRSKNDVSYYFVLNSWGDKPLIYLIRRNSENAEELAVIEPPDSILSNLNFKKGVFALDNTLKTWLREELDAL